MHMLINLIKINFLQLGQTLSPGGRKKKKQQKTERESASSGKQMRRNIVRVVLMTLLVSLIFSQLAFGMAWQLCRPLAEAGMSWLYFSLLGLVIFFLCFMGSITAVNSQIFEAKDNEQLLSLPIRPRDIVLARLSTIFLFNLLYSTMIVLAAGLVYGMTVGFTFASLLLFVFNMLLMNLAGLTVALLLAWLSSRLTSGLPYKKAVSTVLIIALSMGWMYFAFTWQKYMQKIVEQSAVLGEKLKATYLLYLYGKSIADTDILAFLPFLALVVCSAGLIILLLSRSFIRIVTEKKSTKKKVYIARPAKMSSPFSALFKKECKNILSTQAVLTSLLLGFSLLLLAGVAAFLKRDMLADTFAPMGGTTYMPCYLLIILSYLAMTNNYSSFAVSIEGKTIWILRSLPLSAKDILLAKALPQVFFALPALFVFSILVSLAFGGGIGFVLLLTVGGLIMHSFNAFMGLYFKVKKPTLTWTNQTMAIKNSASQKIVVLLNLFLTMGLFVVTLIVSLTRLLSPWLLGTLILFPYLLLAVLFYRLLMTRGVKYFDNL